MLNRVVQRFPKQSIDFLFDHSKDETDISITFYGGEPLLNYATIKQATEYSKKRFETKKIKYNMTTNASLLNDEIIKFIINNSFSLLISLDGNSKIQNYHRKNGGNGEDTFDVVWNNVCKLRKANATYFSNNVRFNAVMLPDENADNICEFFSQNDISLNSVNITPADMTAIDYVQNGITSVDLEHGPRFSKTKENENKEYSIFKTKLLEKTAILPQWHHSGPCVPGVRRLFVSSDGLFFPCEKIDKSFDCKIGSLKEGMDFERIKEILNVGKLNEDDCKTCWAMRFCSVCIKQCLSEGKISLETKKSFCELERIRIEKLLRKYVESEKSNE